MSAAQIEILFGDIISGRRLGYEEAVELEAKSTTEELCKRADRLRKYYLGLTVDTCSIINARSGLCSEDCKWCAQSRFHKTSADIYPMIEAPEAVAEAIHNRSKGVGRFSLVTSGRTLSAADTDKICAIYREIAGKTDIGLCASLGLLGPQQMKRLKECGVARYHCNLETAPSYFPSLCTTHTTDEKIQTLRHAREAGLELCSGGIIGMGESMAQRIELAVTLQELGVDSIPVNVLNPIPGTALADTPPLSDDEILRSMAMMRIINPSAHIRLAGGRTVIKHLERRLLHCGVSAMITGDMLTTSGSDIDSDMAMCAEEGFEV